MCQTPGAKSLLLCNSQIHPEDLHTGSTGPSAPKLSLPTTDKALISMDRVGGPLSGTSGSEQHSEGEGPNRMGVLGCACVRPCTHHAEERKR